MEKASEGSSFLRVLSVENTRYMGCYQLPFIGKIAFLRKKQRIIWFIK